MITKRLSFQEALEFVLTDRPVYVREPFSRAVTSRAMRKVSLELIYKHADDWIFYTVEEEK